MAHFHVGEFNFSSFVSRKWSLKEFHSVTLSSRSCSFECICWHPSLHFEQRLGSSALSLMWLSACWVHRVRGLIRLVRKGMESHPSCQIQLCAPLASKREEIFHFPHFSVGFYVCVFLSPPFVTTASLSPPFSCLSYSLLHSATNSPPFFLLFLFLPLWVWLKVTVHTGSLSQRKEGEWSRKKDEGNSENSRGAWGAGRLSTVLCTHHFFALDMIGEVWKDTWARRLSKNA